MGAVNFHYPRCSCNRSRKTDENNMTDIGDWIPGITERTYDSPTLQKFVRSARQRELYRPFDFLGGNQGPHQEKTRLHPTPTGPGRCPAKTICVLVSL